MGAWKMAAEEFYLQEICTDAEVAAIFSGNRDHWMRLAALGRIMDNLMWASSL